MPITCRQRSGHYLLASRRDLPSLATDPTGRIALQRSSGGRAMDHQFDVLTRVFATCTSRREALALLAAMSVAGSRPGRASAQGDASTCESGLTDCGGTCVDLQSDLNNCGACGEICESGLVPVECRSGVCERANCPIGITYCGIADGCRDLTSDSGHCGACANACASGVCSGGVCAAGGGTCAEGQADCNGICVSTCCDNNNCGACGNVCKGGLTCFEGVCDCPSGNCPPVKLPNTGGGGTDGGRGRGPWVAAAMAGAAAVSALLWRDRAQSAVSAHTEND